MINWFDPGALTLLLARYEVLEEVYRQGVDVRQIGLAVDHQEGVDLALRLGLGCELRGGDLRAVASDLIHIYYGLMNSEIN